MLPVYLSNGLYSICRCQVMGSCVQRGAKLTIFIGYGWFIPTHIGSTLNADRYRLAYLFYF
jgi:hypothetical protein